MIRAATVHEVGSSQMFIEIEAASPGLEIIARWDNFPISVALRSEISLEAEILSLARISSSEQYLCVTHQLFSGGQQRLIWFLLLFN